ncbi:aquaporin-like protein [Ganoderma leucocontextum]|nr:aquaporin-like protein [Ganoderma leucocontextum]
MVTAGSHPLRRRDVVHLADIKPRSNVHVAWERVRHRQAHWFVEMAAEFMGVFFYIYAGVGSTAGFLLGNVASINGLSSIFQIGCAYALGILLAIVVCGPTSGGHLNPAVTLAMVVFRGFSPLRALRYVVAQILGAYIACLIIYVQYGDIIKEVTEALAAAGKLEELMFTPSGPAGVFALYVNPGFHLGRVFLNEFVCDFLLGLVIWACIDPTNFIASPTTGPWIISLTYGLMVWSYVNVGIATNSARDVGARLMALTIWGLPAGGGKYAAIAALTNIPATLLAVCFYEFVLSDSSRVITPAHADYINGHLAHEEHSQGVVTDQSPGSSYNEKAHDETIERV